MTALERNALRPQLAACRLYEKSNAGLHVRDHMNDMPMVQHPKKAHPSPLASQSLGEEKLMAVNRCIMAAAFVVALGVFLLARL